MATKVIIILIVLVVLLLWLCIILIRKLLSLQHSKRSLSVKYGKKTEQFLPFLSNYPYDPENFRFLGTPIDGVQFEDDKITLIEFKTGSSKLNQKQQKIKELVDKKRVSFKEIKI